jgi:hypothetical protein
MSRAATGSGISRVKLVEEFALQALSKYAEER